VLAFDVHPEVTRGGNRVIHLGGMQPSLGGDASPVETGPTHRFSFDERYGQSEIVSVEGRGVPARASTDDDGVVHAASRGRGISRRSLARRQPVLPGGPQRLEGRSGATLPPVQTRFLIIAALVTGIAILVAAAVYFALFL
jgi:hypothetical protein